jgi:hypothetical protein
MSATEKLDRKRPHGTVYGHPGIGFMQDEKPFRQDGSPYVEPIEAGKTPPMANVPKIEDIPTPEQVGERQLTQSEKMKQVWAARRAAEHAASQA